MKFKVALEHATLKKRYKRFLADITTENNEDLTIHCANTGSMLNCYVEHGDIWYEPSQDPKRATKGSWILSQTPHNRLACINTHLANTLVEEALRNGVIAELAGFNALKREVKYGVENSKIDFYLEFENRCVYLEVKSVTLGFEDTAIAAFPDTVTTRGAKHLRELVQVSTDGVEAYILYCVNLTDIDGVRLAKEIDPQYFSAYQDATAQGVQTLVYGTSITQEEIKISHPLPFISN